MQRVLIDTDVILDLFLEREPFLSNAEHLKEINRIVTRNLRDFENSPVRAVSPEEFLAM